MSKKPSQKERVIQRLLQTGQISRNSCLQNYISRLSAIIQILEEEGWVFKTDRDEGDYVYYLITCPFKKQEYTNPVTGQIITKYIR